MNAELRKQILRIVKRDQEMRRTHKTWNPIVDHKHTRILKAIIKKHGWPDKNLVGKDGAEWAWLIAQHADHDVSFQKECLRLMRVKFREGTVDPQHVAYFTDRVLVNSGRPQRYGTQFYLKNGQLVPRPIKDKKRIEKQRKKFCLGPLTQYQSRLTNRQNKLQKAPRHSRDAYLR